MMKRWLVLLFLLTLAPGASQAAGTLNGKITDPDGRPVAGIPLWVVATSGQRGVELPPSAVSGPDGSFSIPGLQPGQIDLYACGRGYLHASTTVWSLDEPVHLEVTPAAIVRGRVLGPDGAPVAGANVFARDRSWAPAFPGRHPLSEPWTPCRNPKVTESGEDGRFEIGPLPPEEYTLQIYSSGLTQKEPPFLRIDGEGTIDGIEIRLRSDGSRKGWLTDTTGAPVEWAHVTVSPEEDEPRTYLSETDGLLRFFADPGPVTFRAAAEGYEVLERTIEIADDETPVELVLVRDESWKTLRGRVTGPEGAPIEGAEIFLPGKDIQTESAADGSFELPLSLREPETIDVFKEGFATVRFELDPKAPPAGEMAIRLEPGAVVTGRLLGLTPGDRGPVARVMLRRSSGFDLEAPLRADDTFRFEHVPAGTWKLAFEIGHHSVVMKRLIVKPGQAEVSMDLSLPPRVRMEPASPAVTEAEAEP